MLVFIYLVFGTAHLRRTFKSLTGDLIYARGDQRRTNVLLGGVLHFEANRSFGRFDTSIILFFGEEETDPYFGWFECGSQDSR